MKRLLVIFLLAAGVCLADEARLSRNTVMRTEDSLIILKAGTVVKIVARGEKTVSVIANGKAGLIPWSAMDPMPDPPPTAAAAAVTSAPVASPPAASPPPAPRPAQTMYGKAVEKARASASSHEKNLVDPADEILGGK